MRPGRLPDMMICRAQRGRGKVTAQRPSQDRGRNDRDDDFLISFKEHAEAEKQNKKKKDKGGRNRGREKRSGILGRDGEVKTKRLKTHCKERVRDERGRCGGKNEADRENGVSVAKMGAEMMKRLAAGRK